MTTTKNDAFIFLLGWIDFWWGGEGEWANFWLVGATSPIPPVGKTLYIYIYILYICIYERNLPTGFYLQWRSSMYITYMCQSGHLTSEYFACHRYIWYIFSLVCSVFAIKWSAYILCNPHPLPRSARGLSLYQIFKKGTWQDLSF